MDLNRKTIIYGALAIIVLMGLFPPWKISITGEGGGIIATRSEYGFILFPPFRGFGEIYMAKLILQWTLVFVIAYGLIIYVKKKEGQENNIFCSKCGKKVQSEDKFCSGCGNEISKSLTGL